MHAASHKVCATFAQHATHTAKHKLGTGLKQYFHSTAHAIVHAKVFIWGDSAREVRMEAPAELVPWWAPR